MYSVAEIRVLKGAYQGGKKFSDCGITVKN